MEIEFSKLKTFILCEDEGFGFKILDFFFDTFKSNNLKFGIRL
jgi:hypothetical protein